METNKDQMVCDLLMGTIDELRKEIEVTKRSSEATITELKQQKMLLQEKIDVKNHADISVLRSENLNLKSELMDKISELEKLRAKLWNGQDKHVQTTEIIDFPETKETQFTDTLSEFGWIEKLLMENIADSERIFAASNVKETTKKYVDVNSK